MSAPRRAQIVATDTLTHALTIHQPYAWALAAGHKPVENRTWRPPVEMVGKLIGIHAGLANIRKSTEAVAYWPKEAPFPFVPGGQTLTYGALIGVARLVGVVRALPDGYFRIVMGRSSAVGPTVAVGDGLATRIRPWWRGPWGWLLEEAVLLPEPIPMRGQQGLWRIGRPCTPGVECANAYHRCDPTADALEQWRKAREEA